MQAITNDTPSCLNDNRIYCEPGEPDALLVLPGSGYALGVNLSKAKNRRGDWEECLQIMLSPSAVKHLGARLLRENQEATKRLKRYGFSFKRKRFSMCNKITEDATAEALMKHPEVIAALRLVVRAELMERAAEMYDGRRMHSCEVSATADGLLSIAIGNAIGSQSKQMKHWG